MIANYWNVLQPNTWPTKPRKHIRPSEIGMSFVDRWASMKGIQPSNPFSQTSLRIFQAGNIMEGLVMRVLAGAGVLNKKQAWIGLAETPENLEIKGRLDATIGGFDNWDEAIKQGRSFLDSICPVQDPDLDMKVTQITAGLRNAFPKAMPEIVIEVKSAAGMRMNSKAMRDEEGVFTGVDYNKLQLYSYLLMTGIPMGMLLYVDKNNFWMEEVVVEVGDQALRSAFYEDMAIIANIIRNDAMPPLEPPLVYNNRTAKFEVNWSLKSSQYLTLLYGYADAAQVEASYHQKLLDVNRALTHLRKGKLKPEDVGVIADFGLEQYKEAPEPVAEEEDAALA